MKIVQILFDIFTICLKCDSNFCKLQIFFPISFVFHAHSRFTEQQWEEGGYFFDSFLPASITAESSPLYREGVGLSAPPTPAAPQLNSKKISYSMYLTKERQNFRKNTHIILTAYESWIIKCKNAHKSFFVNWPWKYRLARIPFTSMILLIHYLNIIRY